MIGGHQVGKRINAGHHRQDADISAEREVQVGGYKGIDGQHRQMKASPDQCRQNHQPQEDQYAGGGWTKGARSHLGVSVDQPASQETEPNRDQGTVWEPQDVAVENREAICDKGDYSGHTDGVLNESNGRIDLDSPPAKLFFAQAAPAGSVGDPLHDQPVHGRDYLDDQDGQPNRPAKDDPGRARYNNKT